MHNTLTKEKKEEFVTSPCFDVIPSALISLLKLVLVLGHALAIVILCVLGLLSV